MAQHITKIYTADDEEKQLPVKWEICSCCNGEGKSSAHLGAFTASERNETFRDDPEFMEDYFAGHFDQPCDACDGTGKVQVVDFEQVSPEDRAIWEQMMEQERFDAAVSRAERRAGA